MARVQMCDVCGKPTERVVVKLYKAPKENSRSDHSRYKAHADVGACCVTKINEIQWQERQTKKKKESAKRAA